QISAIMGSCVAGGAYLPIMSDYALIVEGTGSVFLAGSYLVRSSIGVVIDNETLGGASTHTEISGVTNNKYPDDPSCLNAIKNIVCRFGDNPRSVCSRVECQGPELNSPSLCSTLPEGCRKPYNMLDILKAIVGEGSL